MISRKEKIYIYSYSIVIDLLNLLYQIIPHLDFHEEYYIIIGQAIKCYKATFIFYKIPNC